MKNIDIISDALFSFKLVISLLIKNKKIRGTRKLTVNLKIHFKEIIIVN